MVNYLKAFKRPFSGDKYIFLKAAIPIYNLAIFGYMIECIRNTLQGKDELPDWKSKSWISKVFSIIGASIVILIFYGLPFIIPLGFILVNIGKFSWIISWLFLILAVILMFLGNYYPVGAFISYAKNWSLKDIGYKRISKIVFTWKFFSAWIINFLLVGLFYGIVLLLDLLSPFIVTYLGWPLLILLSWILFLPAWTIIAEAIREIEKEKKL